MHIPSHSTPKATERLRGHAARWGGRAALLGRRAKAVASTRSTAVSLAAAGVIAAGFIVGTAAAVRTDTALATRSSAVVEASPPGRAALHPDRTIMNATAAETAKAKQPAPLARRAAPTPAWVNPMPGATLSSCFGPRWGTMHKGIDFAGDAGTMILSAGSGRVLAAGWIYSGYGISVVVDHGNGYLSHYAHAAKVLVAPGQAVQPGTPLALEGSTGDSTGPHLHFEIHRGMWNQIDPAPWLRARGVAVGC